MLDFACGSGSLLLNVRKQLGEHGTGKIYGQEKNITTYNLAHMNMLLHGVKDSEFEIHHGDSLLNDWNILAEENPAKKVTFDAVVANPHGVLFRGGVEARIRTKLLRDGHIDTVIGLPANLFFSTGIPVCILVLKRCKKPDDVLFINASEHFEKGRRQNSLLDEHIKKIVDTYQNRTPEERYSRRVSVQEIEKNDYNLNLSRYVSTAKPEEQIDLHSVYGELADVEKAIREANTKHNAFLEELGLPLLR